MELVVGGIVASVHACAAALLARADRLPGSRRQLALALVATVPLAGVLLAALACRVRGAGNSPALQAAPIQGVPKRNRAVIRDEAPLAERLVGPAAERRAAIATLTRTGNADAIKALRWLIERGEAEAVVDAALALDELGERHLRAIEEARAAATGDDGWQAEAAAAGRIVDVVQRGIADPSMVPPLCRVGLDLYAAAADRAPGHPAALYAGWASLALAAMRPRDALDILARADAATDPELEQRLNDLHKDALFAAREPSDDPRVVVGE